MSSDMIEAATTSQLRTVACAALPTCLEGTKSRSCVGMTIASSAAIVAFKGNHKVLSINCFVGESRETFTGSPFFSLLMFSLLSLVIPRIEPPSCCLSFLDITFLAYKEHTDCGDNEKR